MHVNELPNHGLMTAMLRYEVLVRVFDGNPDAWLDFLHGYRGEGWAESDREFLVWLKTKVRDEPGVIHRIRSAVEQIDAAMEMIPYPAVS